MAHSPARLRVVRGTEPMPSAIASTPVRHAEALPRDARIALGVLLILALAVSGFVFVPQVKATRKAAIEQERWNAQAKSCGGFAGKGLAR